MSPPPVPFTTADGEATGALVARVEVELKIEEVKESDLEVGEIASALFGSDEEGTVEVELAFAIYGAEVALELEVEEDPVEVSEICEEETIPERFSYLKRVGGFE